MCLGNLLGGSNWTWILFLICLWLILNSDCNCPADPTPVARPCGCGGY